MVCPSLLQCLSSSPRVRVSSWSRGRGGIPARRRWRRGRGSCWPGAEGLRTTEVAARLGIDIGTVRKWRNRFGADRLDGLVDVTAAGAAAHDHRRAGRGGDHQDVGVDPARGDALPGTRTLRRWRPLGRVRPGRSQTGLPATAARARRSWRGAAFLFAGLGRVCGDCPSSRVGSGRRATARCAWLLEVGR